MSKDRAAKKARRKRRLSARNDGWLPEDVHADVRGVTRIAHEIIPRGWEFDREFPTDEIVTWFYPPSGTVIDDESVEPVTRIWLTDPQEPHVILVGSGEGAGDIALSVEQLLARLDAIESHRLGEPQPTFFSLS